MQQPAKEEAKVQPKPLGRRAGSSRGVVDPKKPGGVQQKRTRAPLPTAPKQQPEKENV